jgi:hypothetical protein
MNLAGNTCNDDDDGRLQPSEMMSSTGRPSAASQVAPEETAMGIQRSMPIKNGCMAPAP